MFLIQLLTSSLQREAKARNVEAEKEKRRGGGEKNSRKLAGGKKKCCSNERVSLPEKKQHMHQQVYAFPAGQQRLQMQYA